MEEIIYRKSNEDDLAQISDLLNALDLSTADMASDVFLAAAIKNVIVGCARIIEMIDGNVELASVAVVEEYRKRGIGSKIIQTLLGQEKRRPVYLMCRRKNQKFYEEQGFKEIKDDLLPAVYREKVEAAIKRNEAKGINDIDGLSMIKKI
jgi:N-acetylglutamate synthase-like GNAT family acetyltransferase